MDQPGLDPSLHERALKALARLNRWSGSARIVWPAICEVARSMPGKTCRVLDIATGAGDLPLALTERAASVDLDVQFTAVDVNAHAIAHGRKRADAVGETIDFRRCDVFRDPWPTGEFDVVMCSLFLHHLDEAQAIQLLEMMHAAALRLVVVSDLRRCSRGLWLTQIAAHALTRSPVVHADGPRSVRAAFTINEATQLARQAGWNRAQVQRAWPFRFLLTCNKVVA